MAKSIRTREQKAFRELLRQVRDEAGITQAELGRRIGYQAPAVSKMEAGELRVDLVQLLQICRAVGISLGEFVERFEREISRSR